MTAGLDKDEPLRATIARARKVSARLRAEGRIDDADEMDEDIRYALEISGKEASWS